MTFTLRKKLILGFLGLDIAISFLLGIFMYQFAYGMFLENYKNHKASIVKFISAMISGEEHRKILSSKDFDNSTVQDYIRVLEKVYSNDSSLESIYTINYDAKVDKYYYALYRDKLEKNWVHHIGNEFNNRLHANERLKDIMRLKSEAELISNDSRISLDDKIVLYANIFNTKGDSVGVVIVEANTLEVRNFRSQMTIVAITLSLFTFFVTSIAAFILAKHFTKPLEILSAAVNNLASGNLMMIENFDTKDEFGNLAKSFNVMVNNLKIASEVQYNLIIEISNFNESLERKVEERTHTIQEQSQELEKQIMIAKKIQLSLLPEDVPKINGASLSFRYQPMMGVGGDFIDFDYKNENDLLLFICDVSGHGVPAAFLATMVKMSLQDCYELKLGPAESLKRIHKALQGKLSGHFLSAVYCHINLQDGVMTSANAGHLPILKVGLSGEHEFINSKGRIICEAFKTNSEEVKTKLKSGDKIILYTDGITEARNFEQDMFGDKRLIDISLKYHFDSSFDLCNKIYDSVLNFTGNSQSQFTDDITILVAEYSGKDEEITI
jgi:serine phosphatase RsbU (regulator of sigma subunit)/HAMP domain-containing protein